MPFTTEQMFRHGNQCDGANMSVGCHTGSRLDSRGRSSLPPSSLLPMLFTSADVKSYLISGMWSHQGHLVIPSPEQSPNRIQLSLQNTPKITHTYALKAPEIFIRSLHPDPPLWGCTTSSAEGGGGAAFEVSARMVQTPDPAS